ncbi:MAG: hypothetical protein KFF73_07805 [Cyclobacteriaceae bacterium]|nr:hypothetical protein [Cyclobacteriaceae bacterium]
MKIDSGKSKIFARYFFIILALTFIKPSVHAQYTIAFDSRSGPVTYAVNKLRETLFLEGKNLTAHSGDRDRPDILVLSAKEAVNDGRIREIRADEIKTEGFQVLNIRGEKRLIIASGDETGAMYGLLELEEHFRNHGSLFNIEPGIHNPELIYRIIKFNLPWSPYRDSPATRIHMQTCRDLQFWEKFLDMMAENRFNVLSLWNLHPFPYMIRAKNFPMATPFNDEELAGWQQFWKTLFRMARQRGIQTFIVNWNIVVSREFAGAYGAEEFNDRSDLVKQYTRESVTQVINEYEDLTGIGVTLADWMNNFNGSMSAAEREDWIAETFVEGMKRAERKVKFLHRSVLSGSPIEMRRVIDQAELDEPALVEIKFNWSHGHSTPTLAITHDYHSGEVDDRFWNPKPDNYNIEWMIRNEDFFILRWGQPEFIRNHIAQNNHDYVDGYFIGSEGYIPALDYSQKISPEKTWQYGFEKQWLFYQLWGRLLYDPETPDKVFEDSFNRKYGIRTGHLLLNAYSLASGMPLKLASFYRSTWDYTLYAEGFLAPRPSTQETFFDGTSDFISIDELICHETLEPAMVSIRDYVDLVNNKIPVPGERITPLELADQLEQDGRNAIELLNILNLHDLDLKGALISEQEDIYTWSYLSLYFAEKIRAGVSLQLFRTRGDPQDKTGSVRHLRYALEHWEKVVDHTKDRYLPVPHVSIPEDQSGNRRFSWEFYLPQVERDIKIAEEAISEK